MFKPNKSRGHDKPIMTRKSVALLSVLVFLMLPACESVSAFGDKLKATGSSKSSTPPQLVAAPDSVSAMLADAADRTASALETLAEVEQYRSPGSIAVAPINNPPRSLQTPVSVNWTGPVEPLAKALADRTGYSFATLGDEPAIPIVISVNVTHTPAIEVLRDMGLQMGQRADLRVDSPRRAVEVHYGAPHDNEGLGQTLGTGL